MKKISLLTILTGVFILNSCTVEKKSEEVKTENHQQMEKQEIFFSKTLVGNYDSILNKVIEAYSESKFGLINDIDFQSKLVEKLGEENVDLKRYHILGICNPGFAYKAIQAENKIGVMLPCKVVVREMEDGKVEVSSLNPATVMGLLENDELTQTAKEVSDILKKVIEEL